MCRKVEQEDYLLEQLRVTRWRKKIPREGQNEVGRIWPLPIVTITLWAEMPISFLIPPKQKQFKASWHQVYTLASSNVSTSFPSLCLSHPPLPLSSALHNPVPLKLHPLTLELVPAEPSSPCPFPCLTKISHPFPCLAFNSILTAVGRRKREQAWTQGADDPVPAPDVPKGYSRTCL